MITSHGNMKKLNSCPLPAFPLGLQAEFTPPPAARLLPTTHLIQPEPPLESTPHNSKNNVLILVIVQSLPDGEWNWTNILLPHKENSMGGNTRLSESLATPTPRLGRNITHCISLQSKIFSVLSCRHLLQSANLTLPKAVSKLSCPPFLCYLLIMLPKCTWCSPGFKHNACGIHTHLAFTSSSLTST